MILTHLIQNWFFDGASVSATLDGFAGFTTHTILYMFDGFGGVTITTVPLRMLMGMGL